MKATRAQTLDRLRDLRFISAWEKAPGGAYVVQTHAGKYLLTKQEVVGFAIGVRIGSEVASGAAR